MPDNPYQPPDVSAEQLPDRSSEHGLYVYAKPRYAVVNFLYVYAASPF
jgi:hypothetical protein